MNFHSLDICFIALLLLLVDPEHKSLVSFKKSWYEVKIIICEMICVSPSVFLMTIVTMIQSSHFLSFHLQTPTSHMNSACSCGLIYSLLWLINYQWHPDSETS